MQRFAAFEDSALTARLTRLRRAEVDLQDRVEDRIRQVEFERRWVPSDPLYQRLSTVLKQVRSDLRDTEQEHFRRTGARDSEAERALSRA
jgi:hypothetical protein